MFEREKGRASARKATTDGGVTDLSDGTIAHDDTFDGLHYSRVFVKRNETGKWKMQLVTAGHETKSYQGNFNIREATVTSRSGATEKRTKMNQDVSRIVAYLLGQKPEDL